MKDKRNKYVIVITKCKTDRNLQSLLVVVSNYFIQKRYGITV